MWTERAGGSSQRGDPRDRPLQVSTPHQPPSSAPLARLTSSTGHPMWAKAVGIGGRLWAGNLSAGNFHEVRGCGVCPEYTWG